MLNIGNIEIRLFLDDQEIVRDSALGLIDKDRDFTFLNLNDCKVYDRVDELKNIFKKFDVFTCQFSGAVFHPVCYDYPEKKYKEISESKVLGKFSSVKNLISKFEPNLYIPAAGPPVFLDPKLIDINFQDLNIFSSPFKFRNYLTENMPALNVEVPLPGTKFKLLDDESIQINHPIEDVENQYAKENIKQYAQQYSYIFKDREDQKSGYDPIQVQKKLLEELKSKLTNFNIEQSMDVLLEFSIDEIVDSSIFVNFDKKEITVEDKNETSSSSTYEITCSAGDIGRLLDGYLNWEDFMLSFRHKLKRTPDIYQVAINGFLTMEKKMFQNLLKI